MLIIVIIILCIIYNTINYIIIISTYFHIMILPCLPPFFWKPPVISHFTWTKPWILNYIMIYPLHTFLFHLNSTLQTACFGLGGILSHFWTDHVLCSLKMFLLLGNTFLFSSFMCLSSCDLQSLRSTFLERPYSPGNCPHIAPFI